MEKIQVSKLIANPNNPRVIKDDKFKKLVNSIKEFPEMLEARPVVVNPDMIVLGGNMRLKALKEAGVKEVPVYVASWDEIKQKQFIIKDNVGYGEWDWEQLANEWDVDELDDWGLDSPNINETKDVYTTKVDSPIYETKEVKPAQSSLYDLGKYNELLEEIEKANIPEEDKELLRISAMRHIKFNYSKIADYYSNSDKEVQELMENSALVIIDYDKAIEKGFVKLFNTFDEMSDLDG